MQPQLTLPEEWRPIPGYEGTYGISNHGRVRRESKSRRGPGRPGRILKPGAKVRYATIALRVPGQRVGHRYNLHQLVARAFLGPRPHLMEVNHIDGNRLNNRVDNLEYVTSRQQKLHAYRLGLIMHGFKPGFDARRNTKHCPVTGRMI